VVIVPSSDKAFNSAGSDPGDISLATTGPRLDEDPGQPKLAAVIADQIRQLIIRGEIPEGELLPNETQLAKLMRVSKPTLREAFRILESESLITIGRGSSGGARTHRPTAALAAKYFSFVLQIEGATLRDVYEVSTMLEPQAAKLLAERGSAAAETLRSYVEKEESVLDDSWAHLTASADFHVAVLRITNNPALVLNAQMFDALVRVNCSLHTAGADPEKHRQQREAGVRTHRRLVELIDVGDAEGAEALWRRHMSRAGEILLQEHGDRRFVDTFSLQPQSPPNILSALRRPSE
jgi:GntR family transcriptional regulator, transcriptional repressor for pyruvate dehydrogenase complex